MATKSKQGGISSPIHVLKFGGSSLSTPEAIKNVLRVIKNSENSSNSVVIFSAMGKTTQKLLDLTIAIEQGKSDQGTGPLEDMRRFHFGQLAAFGLKEADSQCHRIYHLFDELTQLFHGLTILKDKNATIQDKILSYGELLSSSIMEVIMLKEGISAHWIDSRLVMITDQFFGMASPILDISREKCQKMVLPIIEAGEVPILQGFIGSTKRGMTSTLGFEGSDYSATLFGNFLNARQVELYKIVDGVMSADPLVEPAAATVKAMNYNEAATLTYLGASCLHAKAIWPAANKGIPVILKNSSNPSFSGTIISELTPQTGSKSITSISNMVMVEMEISGNLAANLAPLLRWLEFERVEIYHLEHSLTTCSLLIKGPAYQKICDRTDMPQHLAVKGLSMVSVVGEGIKDQKHAHHTISLTTQKLTQSDHYRLLFHAGSDAISLLVPDDDGSKVLSTLHGELF